MSIIDKIKSLPPFPTRARVWNPRKKRPIVVKEFLLIPVGPGLWIPFKNITKKLYDAKRSMEIHEANAKSSKQTYEAVLKMTNEEINDVGFFAQNIVSIEDGKKVIVNTDELVSVTLDPSRGKIISDDKPKKKREVFTPLICERRPNRNNGNNNGGNQKKNNGNN